MLLLEHLERQFLAVYQAAISHGSEPPKWHEEVDAFNAALVADPVEAAPTKVIDSEQLELREALGVA